MGTIRATSDVTSGDGSLARRHQAISRVRASKDRLVLAAAVLLPLGLACLLVPFRATFADAAAALLFIPIVVACASMGTRLTGLLATLSSAIWFDFFLTEPYGRLAISHRPDLEIMLSILFVGVVVTELAARSRHHHAVAVEVSSDVSMLHHAADLASGSGSAIAVTKDVERLLIELLSLKACRFDGALAVRPIARIEADGEILHAGVRWPSDGLGIPGPKAEIVVRWRGVTLGRFVLTPTPGVPVDLQRRKTAVALVEVMAPALLDLSRVA